MDETTDTVERVTDAVAGVDQENPLLTKLQARARYAAKFWGPHFAQAKRSREFAWGEFQDDDGDTKKTRVNMAYSTIRALLPHIYAQDPDVSIGPDDGVEQMELPPLKAFGKTLQTGVSRSLKRAGLKTIASACTLASLSSDLSYAKVTYQRQYGRDPVTTRRMEDAQDELARLNSLLAKLDDPEQIGEHDTQRQELENLMASLEQEPDVIVSQGVVMDRVMCEHILPDPAVQQWENFAKAGEIFQILYLRKEDAEAQFGETLKHAKTYPVDVLTDDTTQPGVDSPARIGESGTGTHTEEPLVKLIECWSKRDHTVYTWIEGEKDWAKPPYVPRRLGKRWYPFFPLAFLPTDGRFWPLGMVHLIKPLQNEYNDVRGDQANARQAAVPRYVTNAATDEQDIESFTMANGYEVIVLKGNPGVPVAQTFTVDPGPTYNPALFDVSQIRVDLDMVSGVSDAARGSIQKTKTLGEAEILQANLNSGSGQHRETIENWIKEIAEYVAEMLLLELNPMEAARLCGPTAIQTWPVLDKRDVWQQVKVEIAAGTTGKPNLPMEREAWAKALPVIESLQDKIMMMMAQGLDPAPKVELLKQVLRTMDVAPDIDALLPTQLTMGGMGMAAGPQPMIGDEMAAAANDPGQGMGAPNVVPIGQATAGG